MIRAISRHRPDRLTFIFIISSSTANVLLKIDPSVVIATRDYVDRKALEELDKLDFKHSVLVATTAPIKLTGLQVIDDVAVPANVRVLVKDQRDAKENGLHLTAEGLWTRTQDADSRDEKAEGYGNAAGSLAAAGAALGSFIPILGTVIGGIIGGALGAWGGGELGGTAGKAAFGSKAPINPVPLMLRDAVPTGGLKLGDVARSLAQQQTQASKPMMLKLAEPTKQGHGQGRAKPQFCAELECCCSRGCKRPPTAFPGIDAAHAALA